MTEREAIVAWLRKEAEQHRSVANDESDYLSIRARADFAANLESTIADAIQAGQHLENKDG